MFSTVGPPLSLSPPSFPPSAAWPSEPVEILTVRSLNSVMGRLHVHGVPPESNLLTANTKYT
jgi:hypothetical protein